MSKEARLDYFYGTEGEQFQFLQVPLVFFTDPLYCDFDCDEIMLYSHMLRRICLSRKNGWLDDLNRVYIRYSQKEARSDIRRGKDKVLDAYRTLEKYGLIERIDMGIGKADMIYVKNFAKHVGEPCTDPEVSKQEMPVSVPDTEKTHCNEKNSPPDTEKTYHNVDNCVLDTEKPDRDVDNLLLDTEKPNQESAHDTEKTDCIVDNLPSGSEFQMPWGRKIRIGGFGKTESRDNEYKDNNKEREASIRHSIIEGSIDKSANRDTDCTGTGDTADRTEAYIRLIRKNIGYPGQMEALSLTRRDIYEDMYRVMCDTVCSRYPDDHYLTIGKEQKPFRIVKDVFLKLMYEHLEYAMHRFEQIRSPVTDMKKYLQVMLYNSYLTMDTHITQELKSKGAI